MAPFKWLKRRTAAEKSAQGAKANIERMCEVYGIPIGTPPQEIIKILDKLPDPAKRRIALLNFETLLKQQKHR